MNALSITAATASDIHRRAPLVKLGGRVLYPVTPAATSAPANDNEGSAA